MFLTYICTVLSTVNVLYTLSDTSADTGLFGGEGQNGLHTRCRLQSHGRPVGKRALRVRAMPRASAGRLLGLRQVEARRTVFCQRHPADEKDQVSRPSCTRQRPFENRQSGSSFSAFVSAYSGCIRQIREHTERVYTVYDTTMERMKERRIKTCSSTF